MKQRNIRSAVLAALALTSSAAFAEQYEDYARVRSVTPEYQRVSAPREECYTEYVPAAQEQGYGRLVGPLLGGATGALLGSQVGKGSGNVAATAVGAIAGAVVGDRIQSAGYGGARGHEVQRCRPGHQTENRVSGYRVAYEYGGRTYHTVLPYNPGRQLRVRVSVDPLAGGPAPRQW